MIGRRPPAGQGAGGGAALRGASWCAAIAELGRTRAFVAVGGRRSCARLAAELREGDRVVVLSNGGFGGIHEKLLARFAAERPDLAEP